MPTHRNPALGFRAIRGLAEMLDLAPPLDRASADAEEGGDFLVGALQAVQLFHFGEIDLRFRACHGTPHPFENAQLGAPIRERQTQSLDIGIAGKEFRLDRGNFPLTSFDSYRDS